MPECHISQFGIQEDDEGYTFVTCKCGQIMGPAPDTETALDMAMEHAWSAGVSEGQP